MKRIAIIALTLALLVTGFTACTTTSSSVPPVMNSTSSTPSTSSLPNSDGSISSAPTNIRIGLGAVSSTKESAAAAADTEGNANFITSVCAVAIDENDVILSVKFDTVQSELGFSNAGAFTGDVGASIKTRKEMGFDYGMKETSDIGKEWFEQVGSFEAWMVGQKVPDVLGMKLTDKNTPDVEMLKTTVTMGVDQHIAALEKAYADAL